jgi:thymidylate synthase (FAD)
MKDTDTGWVYDRWVDGRKSDESEYLTYIEMGIKPQEARTCFPNALASRIVATYNLRMWRHFFLMRTTREAHPQMREVTIPLLEEFKKNISILFEDIEPEATQAENLKKMR